MVMRQYNEIAIYYPIQISCEILSDNNERRVRKLESLTNIIIVELGEGLDREED